MAFESKILSKKVFDILYETGKKLSTAESCTSGRVAEGITLVSGASDYFVGSIVCYNNEVKEKMLGVSHDLLEEKTAYCEEVAIAMVKGACEAFSTDYAIATTGIAGPGGGTEKIPVGTVWIACGTKDHVVTKMLTGDAGRERNLAKATNSALAMFVDYLLDIYPMPDLSEIPAPVAK